MKNCVSLKKEIDFSKDFKPPSIDITTKNPIIFVGSFALRIQFIKKNAVVIKVLQCTEEKICRIVLVIYKLLAHVFVSDWIS
jgi:hypothetical protein